MQCWMRTLKIELVSEVLKKKIVFGDNQTSRTRKYNYGITAPSVNDNLTIKVAGTKFPATNKDKGTVTIYNIDQPTLLAIQQGQFYHINIYCGYKSWNTVPMLIFSGEVAYLSTTIHSAHDTECYIIFASSLVARYSQRRMNLALNSSLNVYAVMNYVLYANGVTKSNVDPTLKKLVINEYKQTNGKLSTVLDSYTLNNTGDYTISTDGSEGGYVIDVTTLKNKRFIRIDSKSIPIAGGNPTVTSEGLHITLLPVANLKVGDVLVIDNRLINVAISNAESVSSTFTTNYMDLTSDPLKDGTWGYYMIQELAYTLENRGSTFQFDIKARALSIIKNFTGVSD